MKHSLTIPTRSGFELAVETTSEGEDLKVSFSAPAATPFVLHWGLTVPGHAHWTAPPQALWPAGTQPHGPTAVQTPFARQNGNSALVVRLPPASAFSSLDFALFFPDAARWDNNGGRNYRVELAPKPPSGPDLLTALRAKTGPAPAAFERLFDVDDAGQLAACVTNADSHFLLTLVSNLLGPLLLHWGVARRSPQEWLSPPETALGPGGTLAPPGNAAQTPFSEENGLHWLRLDFPETDAPLGLQFVLRQGADGARWLKFRRGNFSVPLHLTASKAGDVQLGALGPLADEIIRAEGHNSWTLMHRFNLCFDLLDQTRGNTETLALLYVWLRFSAIRQLAWQRNFNTKPRELAHAQDRLTQKLAGLFRTELPGRPLIRLMLTTVGRGGEGQRIRDEILNIMHRHHIKEVSGHFLEEWHQKLHNNTTPDDVVICEAFLEFLRARGNLSRFYDVLEQGGVSRQRLESFERPIRSQPDFVPHLREALLHDFGEFLGILKAAHSGTDFNTALHAVRGRLDSDLQGRLDWLASHRNDAGDGLLPLAAQITESRRRLAALLNHADAARELLYLDLALEQLLRSLVERNLHQRLDGEVLAGLVTHVLENVTLSYEDPAPAACLRHWKRLQTVPGRFDADWSLHAKSVVDRIARALSGWLDRFYQLLQPKAEYLGRGFQADPWSITLFSEEVVRGSSLGFALSALLRRLDPLLRQSARLGPWQIISRGRGAGKVEVVTALHSIQRAHFPEPVIVVADQVMGDEEVPEGVTAVIAPDVTDIVSHVAVRARNAHLLFAACLDPDQLLRLKSLRGHYLKMDVTPAGDVLYEEAAPASAGPSAPRPLPRPRSAPPRFATYAVGVDQFDPKIVGAKSCNQARLRGQVPDWLKLPASVALPFGVFDQVLGLEPNRDVARRLADFAKQADDGASNVLAQMRDTVLLLAAPDDLKSSLKAVMTRAGLAWPGDWTRSWDRIKRVWASKWNDRAFLSRRKIGLPHDSVSMAVLIQQVVPADYAFVIHTVNPSSGDPNELFAEVVLGLGETLVGNYPGRALSFVFNKTTAQPRLASFPGKTTALYGDGLIFRSDSNAEDLAGYAGAGLYDSVLLDEPRHAEVDYSQEPLVWDEAFRRNLLEKIGRLGLEIERACASPQDIEGAVSKTQYYVVQTRPQVGLK